MAVAHVGAVQGGAVGRAAVAVLAVMFIFYGASGLWRMRKRRRPR